MNIFQKYAFETLRKNKTRTLVTILGIVLSVALFTAVTTTIFSAQIFLRNLAVEESGDWNIGVANVTEEFLHQTEETEGVREISYLRLYGYAELEDCENPDKPYLFLAGMSGNFAEHRAVKLTEGRMPESASEVILPNHLYSNGGVEYEIGDVVTLRTGNRYSEDGVYQLTQNNMLEEGEYIEETGEYTFTVVGFYQRPDFEPFAAPGYTALTTDGLESRYYNMTVNLKHAKDAYDFGSKYFEGVEGKYEDAFTRETYQTEYNDTLLRSYGLFQNQSYVNLFVRLGAVLVLIIMFGSVSLIYNSFQISVSERTKQFGILSSIGATKKQMICTVLWEGVFLAAAAVPAGLIVGVSGIGITLYLLRDYFTRIMSTNVLFELHVSALSIGIAVLLSVITVLLSAYLPAGRAMKMPILDAVKMRRDVKITKRQVRVSPVTEKLFGVWGVIAVKNYKRSRRKYRTTIISLFLSIVLFISAGSFSENLVEAVEGSGNGVEDYDIAVSFLPEDYYSGMISDYCDLIKNTEGAGAYNVSALSMNEAAYLDKGQLPGDYREYIEKNGQVPEEDNRYKLSVKVTFLNHEAFLKLLKDNHLSEEEYLDTSSPKALYSAKISFYDSSKNRFRNFDILDEDADTLDISHSRYMEETGETVVQAVPEVVLGDKIMTGAKGGIASGSDGIELVYDESMAEAVYGVPEEELGDYISIIWSYIDTDTKSGYTYTKLEENLDKALSETQDAGSYYIYNAAESRDSEYAVVKVLQVFAFGFIILISLIATANVFNTISTNLGLRRREFAMLKSYGMTEKGFIKMLNLECMLYGTKSLLYGLPVSILISWLIHSAVNSSVEKAYVFPAEYIVISVLSVFLVVYATMLYSRNKIQKENVIDVLKSEVD